MKKLILTMFFLSLFFHSQSQDKILLINGKTITVKSVDLSGNTIAYRTLDKNKLKKMDPYRAFSVQYSDGTERVVYERDSLDPNDFTVDEMRMFIKGEQDAMLNYKNNLNKVIASAVGIGASYFSIYGLVIPAVYATIVGNHSPNIQKQTVSDPALRDNLIFQEGYVRKCRENKIKNGVFYGFSGFAVGFAAFAIFLNN